MHRLLNILYNGFSSETESAKGTFKADGYPQYRWESMIERIELPTDMTQKTQDQATKTSQDSKDPMKMMTGLLGGMMSTFIEPIRIGLQESVRKVTVRVFWDETGRRNQTIEVVQYLTDPSQIEKSMAGSIAGAAGGPGAPGTQAPGTTPTPNPGVNPQIPRNLLTTPVTK